MHQYIGLLFYLMKFIYVLLNVNKKRLLLMLHIILHNANSYKVDGKLIDSSSAP